MSMPSRPPVATSDSLNAALLALLTTALVAAAAPAQVRSPKEFLGHRIGEDHYLCNYTDLVRYFRHVEQASDRVVLDDIGETSYGQTMLMAIVTSPENHGRLDEYRQTSKALGLAKGLTDERARELADFGKAVVWIDAGLHATEVIAGQNVIELVYRMAVQDDPETRNILDNVVLLACPVNPDGLEMVANAYMATGSTRLPVLYQRYVGHDNNRDYYASNQIEAENVNRVFYHEWLPQIVYNHHQSAPTGTIIFTPPFRDPFNYNVDPMVIRGIEIVSAHMNQRFASEDKPGVISRSGARYSTWWNGGLRTTTYFHNMIGILTESFGRPEPTRIRQNLDRRLPYSDYPDPVESQTWHARQTIEYLQTANWAILDYAARYKERLLFDFYQMGRNSIERGSRDHWTATPKLIAIAEARAAEAEDASARRGGGAADAVFEDPDLRDPRGYVLPADQPDFAAAVRLVRALQENGIEVLRATGPFEVGGKSYPAGSLVVMTAQAFRPHVLDMFEPQWHPDDTGRGGQPVAPYDAAGWTLAMQMDVDFDRVLDGFDGPFEPLEDEATFPQGSVTGGSAGWLFDRRDSNSVIAVNRLLAAGIEVGWLHGDAGVDGWTGRPGDFFASNGNGAPEQVAAIATTLGIDARGTDAEPRCAVTPLRKLRIGLFDVYGGNMATGWDQWVLEQFEFPVELVFGARVEAGELGEDFDVLIFHTGLPGGRDLGRSRRLRDSRGEDALDELKEALPPFEDWSTLESRRVRLTREKALPALRAFVEQGGTLLTLGGESEKLIRAWDLPVRVGTFVTGEDGDERRTRRDEFYIPGSLLAVNVDTGHVVGYGASPTMAAMFRGRSPALEVAEDGSEVTAVASYRNEDTLVSGWAIGPEHLHGKAAVVTLPIGKGRLHMFGADVTYRGQPVGTFKLFFNAILSASIH